MKKAGVFLPICVFAVLFLSSGCQGKPVLLFENETYQFGEVDEGAEIKHTFTFRNYGNTPLVISDVRPTCGCTVSGDWTKETAPGQKGVIPLTVKTTGFKGDVVKTINITTNDPEHPAVTLTIEGRINVYVDIQPGDLWLGEVKSETKLLEGVYTLKSAGGQPLKILKAIPQSERTQALIKTISPGHDFEVRIAVSPPFPEGITNGSILVLTDNEKRPEITLKFSYFKALLVEVSPNTVWIYPGDTAADFSKMVYIVSRLPDPVSLSDLKVTDPAVKQEFKVIEKGKSFEITLHFPAGYTVPAEKGAALTFAMTGGATRDFTVLVQMSK